MSAWRVGSEPRASRWGEVCPTRERKSVPRQPASDDPAEAAARTTAERERRVRDRARDELVEDQESLGASYEIHDSGLFRSKACAGCLHSGDGGTTQDVTHGGRHEPGRPPTHPLVRRTPWDC